MILAACQPDTPALPVYYNRAGPPVAVEDDLTYSEAAQARWSAAELELLQSLWLGSLPPLPPDPSNAVADNPEAAALGHALFFDDRLSANGQVGCATCHIPQLMFTDGLPTAHGTRPNQRNTMTIIGTAYNPWFLWDGHKDSQWAQALEPIEALDEHGWTRLNVVHLIAKDERYRALYENAFESLPDFSDFDRFPDSAGPIAGSPSQPFWDGMAEADQQAVTAVFVNLGKAVAAYQRLILPPPTRFDQYIQSLFEGHSAEATDMLTQDEIAGLRLFIGKGRCIGCHQGPLFTDQQFHNTGVPDPFDDTGRAMALESLQQDEFSCRGEYSDDPEKICPDPETNSSALAKLAHAFKTPTLRQITETDPYMHAGQFATLEDVIDHYRQAPNAAGTQTELVPLSLSDTEIGQLIAFLQTLSAPLTTPPELLAPPDWSPLDHQ